MAWVGALVVGGTLLVLGLHRFVPPCLFRSATGLLCPGCGSGRVLVALSRFDLLAAWRANPLVVIALPPVLYALLREALSSWGIVRLPWPRFGYRWTWVLLVTVLAFWVLRNIPVWPFELLAPR